MSPDRIRSKFSRRDFLKFVGAFAAGIAFKPSEVVRADTEHPYIAQPTQTTCGYAVMAMLTAQEKNEDVIGVYKRVQGYFEMIGKYDVLLGKSALKDYFERIESIPINSTETCWNLESLQKQIADHGSTIVCVTTNYGAVVPDKNMANHWAIVDAISEIDHKSYVLVRDPLRSTDEHKPKKKLTSDMIPAEGGSIYIPTDIFIPATGENYLYVDRKLNEKSLQKRYSLVKVK